MRAILLALCLLIFGVQHPCAAQTTPAAVGCHNVNFFTFSATQTLTQFVPVQQGKRIGICGYAYLPSANNPYTVQIFYGTGTNCGTGTTAFSMPLFIVNGGSMINRIPVVAESTPVNQALCIQATGSGQTVSFAVYWAYVN